MPKIKKSFPTKRITLILILLLAVLTVIFFFTTKSIKEQKPSVTPQTLSPQNYSSLLVQSAVWYPSAPWSTPSTSTQSTPIGELKGQSITAIVTSQTASLSHFEDANYLSEQGYTLDNSLSADGPGSSTWGYSKTTNGEKDILLFSSTTKSTSNNPNEPLQFNCPCQITVSVFASESPRTSTGLANPASENCVQKGGTLSIKKNGAGGEYGLCNFEDDMSCEEWALFKGHCPVGGVKTTGYNTVDQMYCVWSGVTTLAESNSVCTFPNGTKCSTADYYNGRCENVW